MSRAEIFISYEIGHYPRPYPAMKRLRNFVHITSKTDIEQVLREKKSFTLRCILDRIKELQGRVGPWNRFASSVSITSACSLL